MSRENNLIRMAAVLSTVALGFHFVEQSKANQVTPPPKSSSEYSPIDIEMTRVAPLTTPGVFEGAIAATAQAFAEEGWRNFVDRGFPKIAVTSSLKVDVQYKEFTSQGSGNLMRIDDYWIVLTAGHVIDDLKVNFDPDKIEAVMVQGDKTLPNFPFLGLVDGEFGVATSREQDIDFGVIVFPQEYMPTVEGKLFRNLVLTKDQINFGQANLDGKYYGLCFPGVTREPTIAFEGELAKFVDPVSKTRILIKNDLATNGCSGGGTFLKDGEKFLYVGPTTGSFGPHPVMAGSSIVANIGSLGEEGFDALVRKALKDLYSRN